MEAWLKNPHSYIQQAVSEGWNHYIWQYGALDKRGIDAIRHLKAFGGLNNESRILLVGDQGTAEVTKKAPRRVNPKALYPTWEYGLNPLHQLETYVTVNQHPGQEHRVVITMIPHANQGPGRRFMAYIEELQAENPETIIHLHGPTRFRAACTAGVASTDFEPHTSAKAGAVILPNGKEVHRFEDAKKWRKWVLTNGMVPGELSEPKKRCVFNIRSFRWASRYWDGNVAKAAEPSDGHEERFKRRNPELVTRKSLGRAKVGDFIVCNHCTKWKKCALYREGQVCTVPDSPGKKLTDHYKSKDPDTILDGILSIVQDQVERYDSARKLEQTKTPEGETRPLDPEVSKIANQLVKTGFDIAKLRQPKGPLVKNVLVAGTANAVITDGAPTETDQHQIIARAVGELEAAGWDRADMTEDHIKGYLETGKVPARPNPELFAVSEPMEDPIEVESTRA